MYVAGPAVLVVTTDDRGVLRPGQRPSRLAMGKLPLTSGSSMLSDTSALSALAPLLYSL